MPVTRTSIRYNWGDDHVTVEIYPPPPTSPTLQFPISRPFGDLWKGLERFQVAMALRHQIDYTFDRRALYNQFHNAQKRHMGWVNRRRRIEEVRFTPQEYTRAVTVPRPPVEYVDPWEQRRRAEARAGELLNRLNPDLFEKVKKGGTFYLKGRQYWFIVNADRKAITVLFADKPRSLCVYIKNRDVQENKYDWAIAMWMHVKSNESQFLKIANHFDWRPETVDESLPRVELNIGPVRGQHADIIIYDDVSDDQEEG